MDAQLLPCPFCGTTPDRERMGRFETAYHEKEDCPLSLRGGVLVSEWNTRSSQWVSVKDKRPEEEGKYLVNSSYGVTLAFYHTWTGNGIFQDAPEHCDEGMENMDGVVFKVTHWMPLPICPENI